MHRSVPYDGVHQVILRPGVSHSIEFMPASLTPNQQQAVNHIDGPMLVLAGPGSGKTRVITHRLANLLQQGIPPSQILAITFTNKAAREMAERTRQLVGNAPIWIGTFHRFCARLLRERPETAGLQSNYSICDTGDQKVAIREVLHDLGIDAVHFPPARILHRISNAKNDLITAEQFAELHEEAIADHFQAIVAKVYPAYQQLLLSANSVDFDDLLLHVARMLIENEELRADLDERYRYILVDEYQDTNLAQYKIVAAISQLYPNLCASGDPDQSIYGWRGAKIDNILRFEADLPDVKTVRLEENFRSTKRILESADRLIVNNRLRKHKALWTSNSQGDPPELLVFEDGKHEADQIALLLREKYDRGEFKWSDCALFYRVNSLSRELEMALTRHRVPHQIAAGVAFYDRREVKDCLAYLRLISNPLDRAAFLRVINTPARGIGKKSVALLSNWADRIGIGLLDAAHRCREIPDLSKRAVTAISRFAAMMNEFSLASAGSVERLLKLVLEKTNYVTGWEQSESETHQQSLANVLELISVAHDYDEQHPDTRSLEGFLESTSLVSDLDQLDPEAGAVTLMTLHAAKGLEFPVVFVVGVEQGLIPHDRSLQTNEVREIEEERRLLFVGMTRAQRKLYLTRVIERQTRGRRLHVIPSEFLSEVGLPIRDFTNSQPEQQTSEKASRMRNLKKGNGPLLMTGAALLNGTTESARLPTGFTVNMKVRHPTYGLGHVVEVRGFARKGTVDVQFPNQDGVVTFDIARSPLQPVGLS